MRLNPTSISSLLLLAGALFAAASACAAHEYFAKTFTLIHPWADATAPTARSAPVYFKLENVRGPDRLLRADTPYADKVELRLDDKESAAALPSIDIKEADSLEFVAGRPHLLLRGLKQPLEWGRSYRMTMVFERAGAMQVMVSVGAH